MHQAIHAHVVHPNGVVHVARLEGWDMAQAIRLCEPIYEGKSSGAVSLREAGAILAKLNDPMDRDETHPGIRWLR